MKILVIEQPLNNRGDESAHRGLMMKLIQEYPDVQIKVLFYGRKDREINEFKVIARQIEYVNIPFDAITRRYFGRAIKSLMILNMPYFLYLLPKIRIMLRFYREADYILCAPGGMNMGGFQDWIHQAFLTLAMYEHKKVIYYGRSIGPFPETTYLNRLFKKNSERLLKYFSYVSLRDAKSQLIAKSLRIKYTPTIDSAFLIETKSEMPHSFVKEMNGDPYIVFVPNSLAWHKNFKSYSFDDIKFFWITLLDNLAESYPEHKIVMLPQTIGYSKLLPDGYIYFNEIKSQSIFSDRVFVLDEQYGSDIQQTIISKASFLIGARYHSVIFSINQAVPFISLSYEHKMNGVVEILGKKDCEIDLVEEFANQPISDILHSDLIERIVKKTQTLNSIKDTQKLAHDIANDGFEELKIFINNLSTHRK